MRFQPRMTGARIERRSDHPVDAGMRLLFALVLLATLTGCGHIVMPWAARTAGGKVEGDVERQREQWNQLVAYRRMDDLAKLAADDVEVVTPYRVISGRKNLVRHYEALVDKRPDLVQIFTPERVERNPRWKYAAERGRWSESWQEQGEETELRGSYYALWKLRDGRWRLQSQIVTPTSCKGARFCKTLE